MCEYCTCRVQPSIARFGEEHEEIDALAADLRHAHAHGDRARVVTLARDIVARLGPHVMREERGLFPELAASGALEAVTALEEDHAALDAVFAAVAADDPSPELWQAIPAAVDRLGDHIWREEYDLFPAAIQLLDPWAWERVEASSADEPTPVAAS